MPSSARPLPRVERPRSAVIAGVAEGVAGHLGWRVSSTRALFVATTALWGFGALLYLWIWAFSPLRDGAERVTRRAPIAWILIGSAGVALCIEASGVVTRAGAESTVLPAGAAIALAVCGGIWSAVSDRPDPARGPQQDLILRAVATAVLFGVALLCIAGTPRSASTAVLAAAFAVVVAAVLGVAMVWASTWIARFRELQDARVQGVRDEQRARMAAHLHDSVLQTLALIQNRAGASSEVGRIARAQERELRSWLYDGDEVADSDLATDLRDFATALELDYPAVVTVVSAGSISERASGEVAAAAREAMLNAARHAGGEVSVYIEGSAGAVEVFVRDRGAGFDLDAVPDDRLGVRESIIGRMRRIGGIAEVGPGPGGTGTQVRIRYPQAGARA